jgi:hypothetical protein
MNTYSQMAKSLTNPAIHANAVKLFGEEIL